MTEYRNPKPTADVIIELADGRIVFIERKNEPRGIALPGGFVDEYEWVADAAVREAKEETGLDVELVELFHVYSDPKRDKRAHMVSTVFIAKASGEPVGGDDAVRAFARKPEDVAAEGKLVFDHGVIVGDYVEYKKSGKRPPPKR
jgi:8-oxo-dGTP diphosphatase